MLYSDALVEVDEEGIRLRGYYFPFGSKFVAFSRIARIVAESPTLRNGRWRIWGSGNLRTWFARDWKRPRREAIFIIHPKAGWWRMAFTVEDSGCLRRVLADRGWMAS